MQPIGYGVLVQGASITMKRTSFVNNDFRGSAAVLLEQTINPLTSPDLFVDNCATEDENLDCSFAAWFATDQDRRNGNYTCVQASSCDEPPTPSPADTSGNTSKFPLSINGAAGMDY